MLLTACLLFIPGMGAVSFAASKSADRAAAEALFNRALDLMKVGDYAGACPQLEESQKLDPAVGTLLYLGECYEQQGMVASAWASFDAAADAARTARQPAREKKARERADALLPSLPRIIVSVDDDSRVPGLEVTRDGVPIGEGAWGVPVPVDSGRHVVQASAPGRTRWSTTVNVKPTGVTRTIRVPLLELTEPSESTATPSPSSAADDASSAGGLSTGDAMIVAGAVVGAVGVAGLVLGVVYGVTADSKESDSEAYCQPPDYVLCTQEGLDLLDESATASTTANVSFVAGAVLVVTGLVLIIAAPSDDPDNPGAVSEDSWRVAPSFGPSFGGLVAKTRW